MVKLFHYLFFCLLISFLTFPQTEDIQQKQSELSSIKVEIKDLEKELASKSAAKKKSFDAIENLNKQSYLINKILSELRKEIKEKENQIQSLEKNIVLTESEIKTLQDNYAKYVVAIYKKGEYNEIESLIDASSLQQAIMRTYYLQIFSEQREKDLLKLETKQTELKVSKELLIKQRNEKQNLAQNREEEKKELNQKLKEKKSILKSIEKNQNELKKLITAKKESQLKIEQLISQLIEKENSDKVKIASTENANTDKNKIRDESASYDYDLNTTSFSSFASLKGKMIWPLHKGTIIRKFGENKHKSLKTVTLNYGIDIKAGKDKNVYCVGEGVVAAIDWLPGYGNVIIVSHKNEYRTVYAHLAEIFISEGDKVKSGTVLALVDEGVDGYVLHFELWKGRDKQNPENWLGKK